MFNFVITQLQVINENCWGSDIGITSKFIWIIKCSTIKFHKVHPGCIEG